MPSPYETIQDLIIAQVGQDKEVTMSQIWDLAKGVEYATYLLVEHAAQNLAAAGKLRLGETE
ncbi:MAG TPA: hypothetical protein VLH19_04355 [Patescibacteria group bacterium]|nr:hypothetical protein [Patescibacteria group bacterium]